MVSQPLLCRFCFKCAHSQWLSHQSVPTTVTQSSAFHFILMVIISVFVLHFSLCQHSNASSSLILLWWKQLQMESFCKSLQCSKNAVCRAIGATVTFLCKKNIDDSRIDLSQLIVKDRKSWKCFLHCDSNGSPFSWAPHNKPQTLCWLASVWEWGQWQNFQLTCHGQRRSHCLVMWQCKFTAVNVTFCWNACHKKADRENAEHSPCDEHGRQQCLTHDVKELDWKKHTTNKWKLKQSRSNHMWETVMMKMRNDVMEERRWNFTFCLECMFQTHLMPHAALLDSQMKRHHQ